MRLWISTWIAALLLASCKPAEKKQQTTQDSTVRLTFWHIMNYTGPREVLAEAVQRFEQTHPGVQVDVQTFENDAYKTKLAVEESSGTPPDIFFTWGGGALSERARANRVLALEPYLIDNDWEKRFIGRALDLCRTDGQLYALPLDLSAVFLWADTRLFEKLALPLPQTFADLLALSPPLRQAGIEPLALGNMKQWPGAFYFCYLANRCGGTALFHEAMDSQASFAAPPFVQAGELLRQLLEAQLFPVGFNGLDDSAARTRFLQGEAAMYLMGTWLTARVLEEKPDLLPTLTPLPFPTVTGGQGDPGTVLGGINCGFAISATCQHPELAAKLLQTLTDDDVVSSWCRIGRIPAVRTSPEQEALLPEATRKALRLLQESPSLQPYYDQYLPPRLAVEHKKTTHNLFSGTMTPQAAADRMAAAAR